MHGAHVQRMRSLVGRNAQHCTSEVSLAELAGMNKKSMVLTLSKVV